MHLQYLVFDASDEEGGGGTFDAMAAVHPDRLGPLLAEIEAVLQWARAAFGPPGPPPEEGEWDVDLQAVEEPDRPLAIRYEADGDRVVLAPATGRGLTTVTFTITGTAAFCGAMRRRFALDD